MKENLPADLVDGAQCTVIAGVHKGKSGIVRDIQTSPTGAVTLTVVLIGRRKIQDARK
jgi:hypothetical protein